MSAKLRLVFGVLSVLSVCFSITGWGQEDHAKQEAIEQMRQVAKAMKQCSEQQTGSYSGDCYTLRLYAGPPTNLEWDVLPSKTVRSPFQGIVEFTLPTRTERIDPPNQSAKAHQKCAENEAELDAMGASTRAEMADELAKKGPEWRDEHFRYEFDVGSDARELVKRLWVRKDRNNNIVTSPANDSGRECWVTAAKSIGSIKSENPAPKP